MIYVHIPYCRRKCLYCDFFSGGASLARWDDLTDALLDEMRQRVDTLPADIRTLYVGGGTPSMMPVGNMRRLIRGIRDISGKHWDVVESTIEMNPDDVNADSIEAWREAGFDRFSLGVQSLDDSLLRSIGRLHDAGTARNAMRLLSDRDLNWSVDLMFGLPGMTHSVWKDTIAEVLAYAPRHVSAYALMYEPGTALTVLRDNGRMTEAPDEEYERQYITLTEMLRDAGYRHYEISNYALPGHESRHNTGYWKGEPYLGLGPGAHSYDGQRCRRANLPDLRRYLDPQCDIPHETEILTDTMLMDEYLITRLRMAEGIQITDFLIRFGADACRRLTAAVAALTQSGYVMTDGDVISLTAAGILTADTTIADIAAHL